MNDGAKIKSRDPGKSGQASFPNPGPDERRYYRLRLRRLVTRSTAARMTIAKPMPIAGPTASDSSPANTKRTTRPTNVAMFLMLGLYVAAGQAARQNARAAHGALVRRWLQAVPDCVRCAIRRRSAWLASKT